MAAMMQAPSPLPGSSTWHLPKIDRASNACTPLYTDLGLAGDPMVFIQDVGQVEKDRRS